MFSTTLIFTLLAAAAQFALLVIGSPIAGDVPLPLQARAPQNFVHPGVVIGRQQLDFVRSKVEAKQHPWYEAYQSLASNRFGDINRPFHPRSVVECGFFNKPDYGCRDEQDDALTAYAMALLWYVSGDKKYADRSIAIMNGWAKAITAHTNKTPRSKPAGRELHGPRPPKSSDIPTQAGATMISSGSRRCSEKSIFLLSSKVPTTTETGN